MPPSLPAELLELQRILANAPAGVSIRTIATVKKHGQHFDLQAISLGSTRADAPAIGFFGGVHGLERIGVEVVIAWLAHVLQRLRWDTLLQQQLQQMRMVFLPIVNPVGLWLGTRANGNGVDLMRNSPVEADQPVPKFLGGQRIGPKLPWYRGAMGAEMETENRALVALVQKELLGRPFSLAVDCHSGFGSQDRLWFPYAHTIQPVPHLAEINALAEIYEQSHPHHAYIIEPQSLQYRTHGDIWDHLYQTSLQQSAAPFLPLTLEMGSWMWIKKNPRQMLSRLGFFNPLIGHRQQRVMRRHLALLDFLTRAVSSYQQWLPDASARLSHQQRAHTRWYG